MPISLASMRAAVVPGLILMMRGSESLSGFDLVAFPHLRAAVLHGVFSKIGDLARLPDDFMIGADHYQRRLVFAGREYPQGWGRLTGGAEAEPPPEPDGKVDTYKTEVNANLAALNSEISEFLSRLA